MDALPTLLLTPSYTEDAQALWKAANQLGWDVRRVTNWRLPTSMRSVQEPVLYLEALFAPLVAEQLGLRLLEPEVDWLPRLPEEYRKREVTLTTLAQARALQTPAFIKPPNDKSFPARVYTGPELPENYDDAMPVLVAEEVYWEKEFRCFLLDRRPRTLSIYLRDGETQQEQNFAQSDTEVAEAHVFLRSVLADPRVEFPRAAVLDVGVIRGRGWAVVEQNAACGAGIYGCDPEAVLAVLRHTAVPV